MIQQQPHHRSVSKFNALAQPTHPLDIDDSSLARLAGLSNQNQWILFTAECPRPDFAQFSSYKISCTKIIHMKPSQTQSELEIVMKAIKSGNASAVVASSNITSIDQVLLRSLGRQYQCEVFFVEGSSYKYH